MLYLFENFVLDPGRRELRRDGTQIPLEPQVFDLLRHLLHNRDRVVSKDDLLATIWGGRIVSESALTSRINAARSAVGDSGEAQRLIRTLRGRGFRFVGAVREEAERPAASPDAASATPRSEQASHVSDSLAEDIALARSGLTGRDHAAAAFAPRRASVAVMPFLDRSSAPGVRGGSADALAHDVITRLAKLRSLFVIAQGTVFAPPATMAPRRASRPVQRSYPFK